MIPLTQIKATEFNVKRQLFFGKTAQLKLVSYEQDAGETTLLTITDGWLPVNEKDAETSTVKVSITERTEITDVLMNQVARFTIASVTGLPDRTYRLTPGGITPPLEQPRIWQLQGEELRDQ